MAMVVVLAGAAAFVYLRLRADLDEGIDAGLRSRAQDVAARGVDGPLATSEESFAQLLSTDGRVLAGPRAPALTPAEAVASTTEERQLERRIAGVDGTSRLLVRRIAPAGDPVVMVVGSSLEDRDETLRGVLVSFLVGGGVVLVLAAGVGYLLATAALTPVLARLRESFERERRFSADASHELRTPLTVLKAELDAALRQPGVDPEVRTSLVAAADEADHMARLADDLLLVARAADGRLPVRPEPLEVAPLLEQARERFGDRAREQGRRIEVDAPAGLRASLDPLRLRQALGNLIDNALRHGAGDVELRARSRDGAVEVDVVDPGPGFPAELGERAFERFARGQPARSRRGAGLGLAIVRAIAEAHGGSAELVDDSGRTTVRLRFPEAG